MVGNNNVSMLDSIKVHASDKLYCYYKKNVYEDCEDTTYLAQYEAVKSGISVATLPIIEEDTSNANEPDLFDNMIPIVYNDSVNSWMYADETSNWYSYSSKIWANAAILVSEPSKTYSAGDTIRMDDIKEMYVWIPRYTYTIFNANSDTSGVSVKEINIQFESGTNSTYNTVICNDTISTYSTDSTSIKSETCSALTKDVSKYTHPAFCLGHRKNGICDGSELTGIWVGKFETGNITSCTPTSGSKGTDCDKIDLGIQIKPDIKSWTGARTGTFYTAIQGLALVNNMPNTDSHLMKNMEWGSVAYLSNSKYGKCTDGVCEEVYASNSQGCYTGRSGGNVGGSINPLNVQYPDSNTEVTNTWNDYGYYTYDGKIVNYDGTLGNYAEDRNLGTKASTTGNIYGIYDMSGGASDTTMGTTGKNSSTPIVGHNTTYESGFSGILVDADTTITNPNPIYTLNLKYTDMYSYSRYTKNYTSRGKLGDATKETSTIANDAYNGWYRDSRIFPISTLAFRRGGAYLGTEQSGLFSFNGSLAAGYADTSAASRVVLSAK